jgi:hypothetical protein
LDLESVIAEGQYRETKYFAGSAKKNMTEMMEHDPCCSKPFQRESMCGKLEETDTWTCPKCGCVWNAVMKEAGIRQWVPHETIEVFSA